MTAAAMKKRAKLTNAGGVRYHMIGRAIVAARRGSKGPSEDRRDLLSVSKITLVTQISRDRSVVSASFPLSYLYVPHLPLPSSLPFPQTHSYLGYRSLHLSAPLLILLLLILHS